MSMMQGTVSPDRTESDRPPGGLDSFLAIIGRLGELRRPPVKLAVWQQVQRGALDLGWLTVVIGSLAGAFTVATIEAGFGLGATLAVRVLIALVLGQLAGFVAALLLVAGPATASTFELGLMRQHGELRTLHLIGVDPRAYLMLPRVLGFAASLLVLDFVFQLAAAVGGFALAALVTPISFSQQMETLAAALTPGILAVTGLRSVLLGAAIGVLVCEHGFSPTFSPARMPQVARQLLSRSLVAVVVVHGGFALLAS